MTLDELERALTEAIANEHTARITGAQQLQAQAMNEIRALRRAMQAHKSESASAETETRAGRSKIGEVND